MTDIVFMLIYMAMPLVIWFLLALCHEKINRVSIINIVTWSIYAFSIIGVLPLYFYMDAYHYEYLGIINKELITDILIISSVNIVFFLLGVLFVRRILTLRSVPVKLDGMRDIDCGKVRAFKLLFLVCVIVLAFYLVSAESVAIIELFKTDGKHLALSRSEMTNAFAGRYYIYALFFQEIALFLMLVSYIRFRSFNKGRGVFISLLVFNAFVSLMAVQKSMLAYLVVYLVFSECLVRLNGLVPIRVALKAIAFLMLILGCVFYFIVGYDSYFEALGGVLMRAFAGSISPAYYYLQYYPHYEDFLFGKSIPNPGGLFDYVAVNYSVKIFDFIDPELAKQGVVGTVPIVFWGEVYVNFGYLLIPLFAFGIGVVLAAFAYFVSCLPVNPVTLGYCVWSIGHFKNLAVTGFSDFIYDLFFWVVTLIVLMLSMKDGKLQLRRCYQFNS